MKFANGKHTNYLCRLIEAPKAWQGKPRSVSGVTRGKKRNKNKKLTSDVSGFLGTRKGSLRDFVLF